MPTYIGICRIKGQNGKPNRVRYTDGDQTWDDMTDEEYLRMTCKPPLDELDWCGSVQD